MCTGKRPRWQEHPGLAHPAKHARRPPKPAPSLATIDIGILAAGPLWRLGRGMAYGVREGRMILDQRDRNPLTGAEFVVPALANPRFAGFTLPALSRAEATDAHPDPVPRLGAARDALWIPEIGDTRAETNRRAIWGAVNHPGEETAAVRGSVPRAESGLPDRRAAIGERKTTHERG